MSETRGAAGGELAAPLAILGVMAGGTALYMAGWLGGTMGVLLAGGGWHPPTLSVKAAFHLFTHGPSALWPGHGTAATVGIVVLLVLVLAALGTVAWLVRGYFGHRPGLASRRDVKSLTPKAVEKRARALVPALADRPEIRPEETGVLLGNLDAHNGPELRASWEDVAVAFMAPRSGKTAAVTIPAVFQAPGPVVATSNKYDLYVTTKLARQRQGSGIWLFDPQGITHQERGLWWDMLAMAKTIEGARRLAGHFALGGGSDKAFDDFWMKAARNLLTALFHSAAVSGGTVNDVLGWLATPADRASTDALKDFGKEALAAQLQATIAGSVETRDGIYQTARECLACLVDPEVAAWVLPDPHRPQFRPLDFVKTKDTLYLLSETTGGSGTAPIIAAAADAVMRAGVVVAERSGGRLPVPMVMPLDEVANICKIADLPELYSHLGSRGIIPIAILQSYQQGVKVWGEAGMAALWSAATIKLLGAGLDDPKFAEDVSLLIGTHLVAEHSVSRSSGGTSTSVSRRRERVMEASQVRAMEKGTALLLATGVKVAQLRLRHWFQEPGADQIAADVQAEKAELTKRALAGVIE